MMNLFFNPEHLRCDIEELKKQTALTNAAITSHMETEEKLMSINNKKLEDIISLIKDLYNDSDAFKKEVRDQYVTQKQFNDFKKTIGVVFAALTLFSGAFVWLQKEINRFPPQVIIKQQKITAGHHQPGINQSSSY